jgi:hypothetical protein
MDINTMENAKSETQQGGIFSQDLAETRRKEVRDKVGGVAPSLRAATDRVQA